MSTKTLVKQAFAATLVALLLGACADDPEPGAQALPSNDSLRGRVDVVLTQPFCDVCSGSDKAFLLARSPAPLGYNTTGQPPTFFATPTLFLST